MNATNEPVSLVDMHVHTLPTPTVEGEMRITESGDLNVMLLDLEKRLTKNRIELAHVILFDERAPEVLESIPASIVLSLAVDFRSPQLADSLQVAFERGISGVKILTYEQKVTEEDFDKILTLTGLMKELGMFLTICSTFGGKSLYRHDALALCSHLLVNGCDLPIVLAHAGGSRVREALLLMDDAPNVYVDTSFTTTFWKGSAVIEELAYLVRRFPKRCFFGSDQPFCGFESALNDARVLMELVPSEMTEAYFRSNGLKFLTERRK